MMDTNSVIEWQEIAADTVVSIYNKRFDGFVRVHPEGYVELTSPAGTVTARFKEIEKVDWLRASYVRMLVSQGASGEELQKSLAAIARVDRRIEETGLDAERQQLAERSQRQFQTWASRHGVNYDQMNDDAVMNIANQAVQSIRERTDAADNE